ncbi:MAG TPA: TRAFs-binding domain-containing protein [Gemmatimonadales bacterium]
MDKRTAPGPAMTAKKRCFVVMGFGIKTDLATGRKLNLDNAYRNMIKPAVEQTGLECVRADEIPHSGNIDVQMYRELLTADVVVADISTVNPNAIYELGVRHALRPWTTVVISESELKYPFDLNHILITSYTHLGDDIGVGEARRFIDLLSRNLRQILDNPVPDSPIYTFLADLAPPRLLKKQQQAAAQAERALREAAEAIPPPRHAETESTLSAFIKAGETAIRRSDFAGARAEFRAAVGLSEARDRQQGAVIRREPYLIQRLALTTYKARQPDPVSALEEALEILQPLSPEESNDPETAGIAGAIHKHLYEEGRGEDHLQRAIRYYSRGYFLRSDLYHGINLAALLTLRAASPLDPTDQERVADLVAANRIRSEVVELCRAELARIERRLESTTDHETKEHQVRQDWDRRFWCVASMAGAYFGLGSWPEYQQARREAMALRPAEWMGATLEKHLRTVRPPLEAYGHLLSPPWALPATVSAEETRAAAAI